ncbi:DUF6776 family protein [Lacimicrobium alkaliphilum]|uniref:Uncharacterized protein n=1 Tax=Lacimicrobium alkaliphilum TaxID=1526571 RepID=A0A0U2QJQ5_9ALTE|nr:DUF6776 family protein [Lacimicrobium alkaliphilum]ALS97339.1 hypothetical protein AT746_03000 [Lacimicrobium alkaliphilum]
MLRGSEIKQRLGAMRFYLLMATLLAVALYAGVRLGNVQYSYQKDKIAGLEQTIESITEENHQLTKGMNIVGVELEVERLANQKLQSSLKQAMEGEADLRQELAFFQKIMAPELEEQGVVIDSMDIEASNSEGYYRFALVLMQKSQQKGLVQGNARLRLQGTLNGETQELDLLSLMEDPPSQMGFSFKYFEVLSGTFRLPEGFVPQRLQVACDVTKPKRGRLERSFRWVLEDTGDNVDSTEGNT